MEIPGVLTQGGYERRIDDGNYGDPHQVDELPEWLAKDTDGWELLGRLQSD